MKTSPDNRSPAVLNMDTATECIDQSNNDRSSRHKRYTMHRPPPDPRKYRTTTDPTWRGILVSYLMVASFPLLLWVVSQPVAGTVVVTAIVGLALGVRHVHKLARCFFECGGFAFELGGKIRVCIAQPSVETAC